MADNSIVLILFTVACHWSWNSSGRESAIYQKGCGSSVSTRSSKWLPCGHAGKNLNCVVPKISIPNPQRFAEMSDEAKLNRNFLRVGGRGRGGGLSRTQKPLWGGYGYFLEQHIVTLYFKSDFCFSSHNKTICLFMFEKTKFSYMQLAPCSCLLDFKPPDVFKKEVLRTLALTFKHLHDLLGEPETWNNIPHHQIWIYPSIWCREWLLYLHEPNQWRYNLCNSTSRTYWWHHWCEQKRTGRVDHSFNF